MVLLSQIDCKAQGSAQTSVDRGTYAAVNSHR